VQIRTDIRARVAGFSGASFGCNCHQITVSICG
jgi:hypothetical protein